MSCGCKSGLQKKPATAGFSHNTSRTLQRAAAKEECQCEDCKRRAKLQRSAAQGRVPEEVPPIVYEVLRSAGQPLEASTRSSMGERLGHDFSRVRIHSDARAAESARAVNARAYTVGPNVVFGHGEYAPRSIEGDALIAHELTHVVQQSTAAGIPQHGLLIDPPSSSLEREAVRASEQNSPVTGNPRETGGVRLARNRKDHKPGPDTPGVRTNQDEDPDLSFLFLLGTALKHIGESAQATRDMYNSGIETMRAASESMKSSGVPRSEIAKDLVSRRRLLKVQVKKLSDVLIRAGSEAIDHLPGRAGDLSYEQRLAIKGTDDAVIASALKSNRLVNLLPGTLRQLSRGMWIASAGVSVKMVLDAPQAERGAVAIKEGAGFAGGMVGSLGVAAGCALIGIASGGLGLLVCGLAGGILGDMAGRAAAKAGTERFGIGATEDAPPSSRVEAAR